MSGSANAISGPTQVGADTKAAPSAAGAERLLLKWGTMKGWDLETEASKAAAQRYLDAGPQCAGVMTQHDTDEQREALCGLIDVIDGPITNDWSGETMTKDEAKRYVREYRR